MARHTVDSSDLLKLRDAIESAEEFHRLRDRMNAQLHLAREARYSPLTNELTAAKERISAILDLAPAEQGKEE